MFELFPVKWLWKPLIACQMASFDMLIVALQEAPVMIRVLGASRCRVLKIEAY
jgi:hypothetical protein